VEDGHGGAGQRGESEGRPARQGPGGWKVAPAGAGRRGESEGRPARPTPAQSGQTEQL
jgi:hypothetical protein